MQDRVPFNRPYASGREFDLIREAIDNMHLSGNGPFGNRCEEWIADHVGSAGVQLTPSCTAALEMASILAEIEPGDEVIMPSFTFVSTANAFVLRGAGRRDHAAQDPRTGEQLREPSDT
jgi:dTDP-4-amino-4,6-dideoxygalactose transaminase